MKAIFSLAACLMAASAVCGEVSLSFWRAETDNDRGNKLGRKSLCWRKATIEGVLPDGVTTNLLVTTADDGTVYDFTLSVPENVPEVPRVGLEFKLPGDLKTRVCWHGAGPWENYIDRCTAAKIGDYEMSVAELNDSHYIRPQECGHRTQTTSLKVGDCVFTAMGDPFEWNVHPWSTSALDAAWHVEELPPPDGTLHVFIDAVHRGVGGDDSWGAPVHAQYRYEGARTYRLQVKVKK